jgi:hypothetical protein
MGAGIYMDTPGGFLGVKLLVVNMMTLITLVLDLEDHIVLLHILINTLLLVGVE